jgi:mannosyltransferase
MTTTTTRAGSSTTPPGELGRDRAAAPGVAPRLSAWVPWILGLIATAVSAAGSWIPSLWGDEATSVMSASRSLPSLFRMLGHVDAVHGTYYFGLHWWIAAFGASPFSVRLPPAIAVGFAVVAVVLLVRRIGDPRTAVIAGLVCILLPRVTYMGEESRSYAFSAAIAAWLLVLLVDLVSGRRSGARWWAVYAALLCYGIYTFLFLGLFIAVHALVLLCARVPWKTWRRWAVATAAALAAAAPVIDLAYRERSQIAFLDDSTTTDPVSLLVGLWFTNTLYAVVAWALILSAVAFWVVGLLRRRRAVRAGDGDSASTGLRVPSLTAVGLLWLFVPGVLLLVTNLFMSDFTGRYLSMSAPGAALLIAAAVRSLAGRRRLVAAVLTLAVLAVSVPAYLSQRTPYAKNGSDWAEVSKTVGEHAASGEAIVFDEAAKTSRNPRLALHTYPAGFRGLHDVTLSLPYTDSVTWRDDTYSVAEALAKGRFDGYRTVWVVEYAAGGTADTYGLSDLEHAGYSVHATYSTHSSRIYELTR